MELNGFVPSENFPAIGTVENPALFYNGSDLLLCYEVAPVEGGGIAVLQFAGVIDLRLNSMNVDGLGSSKYPVQAWSFTEVSGSDKQSRWKAFDPRFWTISFNDQTVEVLFETVDLLLDARDAASPETALRCFLTSKSEG